jgi:FtsH-binding integral membrane protein
MIDAGVFERGGIDTMSRRMFYLILGGILAFGFAATAFVSDLTATWQPNVWVFLLVGLGLPLAGIYLSQYSSNAFVSFIGFNMVVIPFGAILGPLIAEFKVNMPGVVTEAAMLTGFVTAVMALAGLAFPNFFSKIGGALFVALLCLIGVSLVSLFIPALAGMTWIHYIAAAIFALYIGFDMWRASQIPATLDNAVDVAVSLYLDILNLFLRILMILSKSRK